MTHKGIPHPFCSRALKASTPLKRLSRSSVYCIARMDGGPPIISLLKCTSMPLFSLLVSPQQCLVLTALRQRPTQISITHTVASFILICPIVMFAFQLFSPELVVNELLDKTWLQMSSILPPHPPFPERAFIAIILIARLVQHSHARRLSLKRLPTRACALSATLEKDTEVHFCFLDPLSIEARRSR